MSAIMKWVLLSIAVHVLVFGANWIVNSFETKYQDMRSIELHLASRPRDNEPIPEISDTGASKKKPVIQTNKQTNSDDSLAQGDLTNYLPSYLADLLPTPVEPIIVNYPEEARQQGIVGKVLLQLYIDAAGNVRKAEVVTSPSIKLSDAALKAVANAKFYPAKIGGQFKAVITSLVLNFYLQ